MSRPLTNRWVHAALLLAMLSAMVVVRTLDFKWAQSLGFLVFDTYNRIDPRPATGAAVVVDIDDASLAREDLGQWPWSRLAMAQLVDNLKAMGARAIVFDIVFAESDRNAPRAVLKRLPALRSHPDLAGLLNAMPDNDDVFARSIRDAGNVVTGFVWSGNSAVKRKPVLSQPLRIADEARDLEATVLSMPAAVSSLPLLEEAAAGDGCFGVASEKDGVTRRVPLLFNLGDPDTGKSLLYPSLALEAVRVAQGQKATTDIGVVPPGEAGFFAPALRLTAGRYAVPLDRDGELYVYFSRRRAQDYIPAWTVIDGSADPAKIRDEIVFVGTSAEGLMDMRATPLNGVVPGVEIHVNAAEQILSGNFLLRPPGATKAVEGFAILAVGLLIILLLPMVGAVATAAGTAALMAIIAGISWYGFERQHLLLDPLYPDLCILVTFGAAALLGYIRTEAERRQVKQAFGMYISPDLLEDLARNPGKLALGGETRDLTVMFTDIRGFTGIAESMPPAELIQLMNAFLTPMSDIVMDSRGTIDKYIGDAMMAFWNAPVDDPEHARHACAAALRMNSALEPINENLRLRALRLGKPLLLLTAGIGVNSGSTSVGNMGSRQRFAYSAIGDTVNLAARLEGQTRTYNANIIIGEATRKHARDFAALELDLIQVKGKKEPSRIYALIGDEAYAAQAGYRAWEASHTRMVEAYRALDFTAMQRLIDECLALAEPGFRELYVLYQERLADFQKNPPDKNWDGVYVALTKK